MTHTSERDVECQLCYVKLKGSRILKDHQKKMHQSEKEQEFLLSGKGQDLFQFDCNDCNLKFLTEDLLLKHQKQHEINKLNNFNCQFCPQIFFKLKVYNKHLAEIHSKPFSTDQTEKRYGCKLCYRGFKFNRSLQDHIKKIHENDLKCRGFSSRYRNDLMKGSIAI